MKNRGISQEALKLLACAAMLIDHTGATIVYDKYLEVLSIGTLSQVKTLYQLYWIMRIIGRIAFPIFCFLLAEGVHYTRSPKKYALRLTVGAALSELPFDLALFGGITLEYQSVMLTMLLGFFALQVMAKCPGYLLKCLSAIPFALLAEWLLTDYGGAGVILIALFGITRELPHRGLIQLVGMVLICNYWIPGAKILIGDYRIAVELFAVLALIPIALYSGRKRVSSKAVQWGFYLFYPIHLWILYCIGRI